MSSRITALEAGASVRIGPAMKPKWSAASSGATLRTGREPAGARSKDRSRARRNSRAVSTVWVAGPQHQPRQAEAHSKDPASAKQVAQYQPDAGSGERLIETLLDN